MLADRTVPRRSVLGTGLRMACIVGLAVAALAGAPAAARGATPVPARPASVAVVVPLVFPAGTTGLVPAETLAEYTAETGILTRELDDVAGRNVTVGIDPAILASIRVLGDSAPPSALAWLDRLSSIGNETFALTYSDSDLTLATQAGSSSVPGPISFAFAIDPTRFAPAVTPPGSTNAAKPPLPTTQSLLSWQYTIDKLAWPRGNSVVAHDLDAISSSGFTATLLASSNLSSARSATTSVEIAGQQAIVSADAVSTALRGAIDAASDASWQLAMARLSAAIADAAPEYSTVIATTGRDSTWAAGRFTQTIDALASNSSITGGRLSTAIATAPMTAVLADRAQSADSVAAAGQLLAAESAEGEFASVAADPTLITGARRIALLAVLSNQSRANEAAWPAVAAAYLAESTKLLSSVAVVSTSGVNLFADRASLPITVSNGLDQAVTVIITVRPDTGLLTVEDTRVRLDIPANSQGKGLVPVQAISNGTVRVTVHLESLSGAAIGVPSRTPINVQAGWETPIVVVMAGLVIALFVGGLARSIYRKRRGSREQ